MAADAQALALLLAEGESAKAKALHDWLDTEHHSGSLDARAILWRTYFAHMAAAERYLELAKTPAGVPGTFNDQPKGGA